jgi:hypothetical protein
MNRQSVSLPPRVAVLGAALLLASGLAAGASQVSVPLAPGGGSCTANPNNYRFGGKCGALINFDGTNAAYVQDDSPSGETTYRARMYSNFAGRAMVSEPPNNPTPQAVLLDLGAGEEFDHFVGFNQAATKAFRIQVAGGSDAIGPMFTIQGFVTTDAGEQATGTATVRRGWTSIEVDWAKSTSAGANNGRLNLWVNGTPVTGVTGADIDTAVVDFVRWGVVDGFNDDSISGTIKQDDFVSQRTDPIGPALPFSDNTNTASPIWKFVQSAWANELMFPNSFDVFGGSSTIRRDEMAKWVVAAREGTDFDPPNCAVAPFNDVPCTAPYAAEIAYLKSIGVVAGCDGSGNYCPANLITRSQMMIFILVGAGEPPPAPCGAVSPFSDVPPDNGVPSNSPFCRWIKRAVEKNLTVGCAPGAFCPNQNNTKDQMAVFVHQGYKDVVGLQLHLDAP